MSKRLTRSIMLLLPLGAIAWVSTHTYGEAPAAVGRYTKSPRLATRVEPKFPEEALRAKINGSVGITGLISEQGKMLEPEVTRSAGFGFDESAMQAVRLWTFDPAERQGKVTSTKIAVTIPFHLPELETPTGNLHFDLPRGATRPILERGTVSDLQIHGQFVQIDFKVAADGSVDPGDGDGDILHRLKAWHFLPATNQETPISVSATLSIYPISQ